VAARKDPDPARVALDVADFAEEWTTGALREERIQTTSSLLAEESHLSQTLASRKII
jgi:hypothetical protein